MPCGYEKRARDAAEALKERFDIDATLIKGKGGVFQVVAGDTVLAKRTRGYFPSTADIVNAVSAALLKES